MHCVSVHDARVHELDIQTREVVRIPRAQVVNDAHGMSGGEGVANEIRADEAGTAGDKDLHACSRLEASRAGHAASRRPEWSMGREDRI